MAAQPEFFQRRIARRLGPPIERRTHIAVADLLRLGTKRTGWWFSHIGHGERRSEKTGALLKRMGLKPGMPDFLLISPKGELRFLELKRGAAPLTEGQEAFIAMCAERDVPVCVARSYEAAVKQLKEWGAL